jgi:hypothetical protein
MVATEMVGADVFFTRDEVALRAPAAARYHVTLNPRRAVSEWDASLLGGLAPLGGYTNDRDFYDAYVELLFPEPTEPPETEPSSEFEFDPVLEELIAGMQYKYVGSVSYEGAKSDVYTVTLPKGLLNDCAEFYAEKLRESLTDNIAQAVAGMDVLDALSLRALSDRYLARFGLYFENDAVLTLTVTNNRLVRVEYTAVAYGYIPNRGGSFAMNGDVRFPGGDGVIDIRTSNTFSSGEDGVTADIAYYWAPGNKTGDNYKLTLSAGSSFGDAELGLAFGADGTLRMDADKKNIEYDFKRLYVSIDNGGGTLDASVSLKTTLRSVEGFSMIQTSFGATKALSEINLEDVALILERLQTDPQLGILFGACEY